MRNTKPKSSLSNPRPSRSFPTLNEEFQYSEEVIEILEDDEDFIASLAAENNLCRDFDSKLCSEVAPKFDFTCIDSSFSEQKAVADDLKPIDRKSTLRTKAKRVHHRNDKLSEPLKRYGKSSVTTIEGAILGETQRIVSIRTIFLHRC